jgi:hypothetical protein
MKGKWYTSIYLPLGVTLFFTLALVVILATQFRSKDTTFTPEEPIQKEEVVESSPAEESQEETVSIPTSAYLDVPFTAQAPFGVWDELHGETCEEASLLMVKYFISKESFPDASGVDSLLVSFVQWQEQNGYKVDITVKELLEAAERHYGFTGGRLIENPTIEDIQKEIAAGRPVIVPAAGQALGNPYFTPPGPKYHMFVVKGYENGQFITNDPGTRRGKDFRYDYDTLMEAIHDWDPENIYNGRSVVLVYGS